MISPRPWATASFLLGLLLLPVVAKAQTAQDQTINAASVVLDEIMAVPAKQIPASMLADAHGVAIIPSVVKGGFVVGIRHGRGVVLVRDDAGNWTAPMFASLTGGSVGWQAGVQSTDVILVFRTRRSIDGLMSGKMTIGVDAAAAAGPVGRQAAAATDATLRAEILSYSRSRGLFAGVSIDGSVLSLDHLTGSAYYGAPTIDAYGETIPSRYAVPEPAVRLANKLTVYTRPVAEPSSSPGQNRAVTGASQSEAVRQQLVSSWQSLAALLDDGWKSYLVLPGDVLSGEPVDARSLKQTLDHYALVAADGRYSALTGRSEFSVIYRLLRDFSALQPAGSTSMLTLPPPPRRR